MSLAVRRYSEALLDIAFEENCEDEVYEIPDKNKKSASEAPKLKEDNPDHRKKS